VVIAPTPLLGLIEPASTSVITPQPTSIVAVASPRRESARGGYANP
jgi:hypothetical protein